MAYQDSKAENRATSEPSRASVAAPVAANSCKVFVCQADRMHNAMTAVMERPFSTTRLRECIGQPQSSKDVAFLALADEVDRLQAVQDLAIAALDEMLDLLGRRTTKQEVGAILAASQRARTILIEGRKLTALSPAG